MKKLIDLPDNVIETLSRGAKEQNRSIKAHLEYILINESNKIVIADHIGGNVNFRKGEHKKM